jgi:hypothetical protein
MNHHKSPFITNETQRYPVLGRRQLRFFPAFFRQFHAARAKNAGNNAEFLPTRNLKKFSRRVSKGFICAEMGQSSDA